MDGHVFLLSRFSRSLLFATRPLPPHLYKPIKSYSQVTGEDHGLGMGIKAPSTADEFKRVAEEKEKAKAQDKENGQRLTERQNGNDASEKAFPRSEAAHKEAEDVKRGEGKRESNGRRG